MTSDSQIQPRAESLKWLLPVQIRHFLLIAAIGVLYATLLFTAVGPLQGFWSTDQGVKLFQVQSLLLNKFHTNALIYPGEVYDPAREALPFRGQYLQRDGQTFAMFSAPFAYLSSVPFFIFGYPGLYLIPLLAGLVSLWFLPQIGQYLFSPRWQTISLLMCGLATPLLFYSLNFWEHTLAVVLVLASFTMLLRGISQQSNRRLLLAGLFMATASWFRNEAVLGLPALVISLLLIRAPRGWTTIIWFGIGGVIGILPLFAFNQLVYGIFLGPHVVVAGGMNYRGALTLEHFLEQRRHWAQILLAPFIHQFVTLDLLILGAVALVARLSRRAPLLLLSVLVLNAFLLRLSFIIQLQSSAGLHSTMLMTVPLVLLCVLPPAPPTASTTSTSDRLSPRQIAALLLRFSAWYIGMAWLAFIPDGGAQWGARLTPLNKNRIHRSRITGTVYQI